MLLFCFHRSFSPHLCPLSSAAFSPRSPVCWLFTARSDRRPTPRPGLVAVRRCLRAACEPVRCPAFSAISSSRKPQFSAIFSAHLQLSAGDQQLPLAWPFRQGSASRQLHRLMALVSLQRSSTQCCRAVLLEKPMQRVSPGRFIAWQQVVGDRTVNDGQEIWRATSRARDHRDSQAASRAGSPRYEDSGCAGLQLRRATGCDGLPRCRAANSSEPALQELMPNMQHYQEVAPPPKQSGRKPGWNT